LNKTKEELGFLMKNTLNQTDWKEGDFMIFIFSNRQFPRLLSFYRAHP